MPSCNTFRLENFLACKYRSKDKSLNVFTEAAGSGPDEVPGGTPEKADGGAGPEESHGLAQGKSEHKYLS